MTDENTTPDDDATHGQSAAPDESAAPAPQRTLVELAVDRPVAVTMIVLAVAVFGWVSLQKLKVTLLPRISYPSLTIRTEYPGAAPGEVEELVTKQLENNVAVISNLNSYRSISRAGVSDIILEFEWNTPMSFAAQDVREKVDQVRPVLPQDIKKPLLLKYDPTLDPILRFGIYGSDDLTRMRFFGEEKLKKKLEAVTGVAAVRVRGGFESEIRVALNELALRQHDVSVELIQQRLREENVNLASGILRDGDVEYLVRTLNEFRSIDEIRRLVITTRDRQVVRLDALARVQEAPKEADVITRINGQQSVEIAIYKEDSSNVVSVAQAVKATLFGPNWRKDLVGGELKRTPKTDEAEKTGSDGGRGRGDDAESKVTSLVLADETVLAETLPVGMKIRLLSDQSRFVENSVTEVQQTAIYGAIISVLVLLVFLRNWVPTLIIAVAIPISVIATFGPMMYYDVTLNIMSLGGLALGIGMLVDASIVVLESIDRCRREGDAPRAAAVRGAREVAGAVTASVLTTVAVFLPIVFVRGIAGEIFKDQSLTVVFSLVTSLVVAVYFIPMLAARPLAAAWASSASVQERLSSYGRLLRRYGPTHPARWTTTTAAVKFGSFVGFGHRNPAVAALIAVVTAPIMTILLLVQLLLELAARIAYVIALLLAGIAFFILAGLYRAGGFLVRPFAKGFDLAYAGLERAYAFIIGVALRLPLFVILVSVALLWLAWQRVDRIGMELIPEMHSGEIIVEAPQPVGTSLATTSRITRVIEQKLEAATKERRIGVLGQSSAIGVGRDEIAPAGEGAHTAKVHLTIPVTREVKENEARVVEQVRRELSGIPEVGELTFTAPKLFTFQNPLEVQVKGDDLTQIEEVARRLELAMQEVPGLVDVKSTLQEGSPEFVIEYDRVQLARYGMTLSQAAATLRDKIKGTIPTKYSLARESRKIDILVKIPEDEIASLEALEGIQVSRAGEPPVRLADVAHVRQGRGPSEIRHIGGERAVLVNAIPDGIDLKTAAVRIEEEATRLRTMSPELFKGVVVGVSGQSEEAERSSRELLFALGLALILVYIVMASQFESLLDPLVIMVSSVFAGVGVVFALDIFRIPASAVVFIGGIMLAGIVVNNAIVLIDRINRLQRGGMDRRSAIIQGSQQRLRPILMTTATTVLGLIPMAISRGEGAEMRVPMAITVIAGLATSTVLTLVIIPVVYSIAHRGVDLARSVFSMRASKESIA